MASYICILPRCTYHLTCAFYQDSDADLADTEDTRISTSAYMHICTEYVTICYDAFFRYSFDLPYKMGDPAYLHGSSAYYFTISFKTLFSILFTIGTPFANLCKVLKTSFLPRH